MESVIFEIKERGGLIFKSELGGGVLLFKGRIYFEMKEYKMVSYVGKIMLKM